MIYYLLRNKESEYNLVFGISRNPSTWVRLCWTPDLNNLLKSIPSNFDSGTNTKYFEPWYNNYNADTLEDAIRIESNAIQEGRLNILVETSDLSVLTFESINQSYPELLL